MKMLSLSKGNILPIRGRLCPIMAEHDLAENGSSRGRRKNWRGKAKVFSSSHSWGASKWIKWSMQPERNGSTDGSTDHLPPSPRLLLLLLSFHYTGVIKLNWKIWRIISDLIWSHRWSFDERQPLKMLCLMLVLLNGRCDQNMDLQFSQKGCFQELTSFFKK